MKPLPIYALALSVFSVLPALAAEPVTSDSTADTDIFLISLVFENVDFIYAGELAHYTAGNQNISFRVFPIRLINETTQADLLGSSPDAFFAISEVAFERSNELSQPFQYCLDMIREMAINTNSGAQMFLFARVKHETGVNFVIRKFHSCGLHPATSSNPPL
jgi:hypothetical protein